MANQRTVGICVSYNGVCLQDCEILEWDHRVQYDEASGNIKWDLIRLTVSSMVVSNASLSSTNTINTDASDPNRFHPSQSHTPRFQTSIGGFLTTDNLLKITTLLKTPKCDFAMWINNASEDPDQSSVTVDGVTTTTNATPKTARTRTGAGTSRRFLLAACGYPGGADYPSAVQASTENDFLAIYDPWKNINDLVRSDIRKRDALDCNNGPRPISVSPIPMAGSKTFRLVFTIEISRAALLGRAGVSSEGSASNTAIPNDVVRALDETISAENSRPIVVNNWSFTDSEDEAGRVTHTITGKLIVSDIRYKPNAMRMMAFPLAFPYARLMSRRYTVSEDGKTLLYEFSYTHAGAAPPEGVRDYMASYSEQFGMVPALMHGVMNIRVKGWYHRSTDNPLISVSEKTQKMILLRQAHTILLARIRGVTAKLQPIPGQNPNSVTVLDVQVIEQVGVPEVELRVKVMYGSANGEIGEYLLRLENLGAPFFEGVAQNISNYDPKWWPIDNVWARVLEGEIKNPYLYYLYPTINQDLNVVDYANNFDCTQWFEGVNASPVPPIHGRPESEKWEKSETNALLPAGRSFLDGSRPTNTSATASPDDQVDAFYETTNPLKQSSFAAVVSQQLNGRVALATRQNGDTPNDIMPLSTIGSTGIYDLEQAIGAYSYIEYDSEVSSSGCTGIVVAPLSAPRELAGGELRSSSSSIRPQETSATIRLFAGSGERIIKIKAERMNKWPEVPEVAELIIRYENLNDGNGGTPVPVAVERLVKKEMIQDAPRPLKSGNGVVYTIHLRLTYKSTRPFCPTQQQAGYMAVDVFPFPQNAQLKTDPQTLMASRATQATIMTRSPFW